MRKRLSNLTPYTSHLYNVKGGLPMLYRVFTALVCLAVMVLAPIFVKEQRGGPCPRSLFVKMVAAPGYMAAGGLCVAMTGVCSAFDKLILLALFA